MPAMDVLFKENFESGLKTGKLYDKNAPWFFFEQPGFISRDPAAKVSTMKEELTVDIPHYTLTTIGVNDHPKFMIYSNTMNSETGFPGFKAPDNGEIYYEANIVVETYGTENNPFNVPADDFRLSSGGMVSIDFDTFMVYDFFMTPTKAYALYERLPFDQKVKDPAAFFTYVIPLIDLESGVKYHYKLSYNKSKYLIMYYIDGKRVFEIDEFGRRLASDYEEYSQFKDIPGSGNPNDLPIVQSNQRIVGSGLFTMLDSGMRHGKELANIHEPSLNPSKKVFGQGGKIVLSDIVVGIG
jgi:uncharacterized protein DUF6081